MTLFLSISVWAYFNINYQKKKVMETIVEGTDKLSNTIKLGTHYAMMINSRDDINQIITNIAKQKEIENIRIYNKDGEIKFSNSPSEVDLKTNIKAEACDICHKSEPPLVTLGLNERIRIFESPEWYRLLGIISPIYNEPGCSTECHFHPEDKKILGALDVVISLEETDREILIFQEGIVVLALFVFLVPSSIIFIFVLKFVNLPIRRLIEGAKQISKGNYAGTVSVDQDDEMGKLALAISQMSKEIGEKQAELNKQRDEYQNLFERVPCFIAVLGRDYKLIRYNREFAEKFDPIPGGYCFSAYKGRVEKCEICPVEKTFEDGMSRYSEQTGISRDGERKHWIVKTSPVKNVDGEIIAAMEIGMDITHRKMLEEELKKSEKNITPFSTTSRIRSLFWIWRRLELLTATTA